jgi:hypothetical protein
VSNRPILLGEIAEKDGLICLRSATNVWFPLDGNSGVAERFRESFGEPARHDIGKRLYNSRGVIQMENDDQRRARQEDEK